MRAKIKQLCVFFVLLASSVVLYLVPWQFNKLAPQPKKTIVNDVKTILYWTPMFRKLNFRLGLGSEMFANCNYKNCYATHNRSYTAVDEFDAIVFHGVEYTEKKYGKPERRSPHQIYIFGDREPPPMTQRFINNFYNWTMTYRLDSDVPRLYGSFIESETEYQPPTIEEIEARPKKIAWVVSHCKTSSKREIIVKELSKYIPVDIFGTCGKLSCGKRLDQNCYNFLEKNYKFYLSFENSVCEDYITEKAYYIMRKNVIPIVYGGADYDSLLPPNSVINVIDHRTVKDLANYIQYLDTHTEEYLQFFEWKKDYYVETSNMNAICTLCQKLNEEIVPKTYSDISIWWRGKKGNKCWKAFNTNFLQ